MSDQLMDRDAELRHIAVLAAEEVRHTAAQTADYLTGTAAQTALNLGNTSEIWKWLLGAAFTILVLLFGTAYNQLVNSDTEMKKELTVQNQKYQVLSENMSAMTANQTMVMQMLRDNSAKLDRIVQQVYSK